MRTRAAASLERSPTSARQKASASCAWSGVATLPVPIAQIGSLAATTSGRRAGGNLPRPPVAPLPEPLLGRVARLALGVAGLAPLLGLAEAEDRHEARLERGDDLE